MSKAVFLTGTGTDIGKTYISGLIVKKLAEAGAAVMKIAVDKIKDVIGSQGKNIKNITETTQTKIDIEDNGTIKIMGVDKAKEIGAELVMGTDPDCLTEWNYILMAR